MSLEGMLRSIHLFGAWESSVRWWYGGDKRVEMASWEFGLLDGVIVVVQGVSGYEGVG